MNKYSNFTGSIGICSNTISTKEINTNIINTDINNSENLSTSSNPLNNVNKEHTKINPDIHSSSVTVTEPNSNYSYSATVTESKYVSTKCDTLDENKENPKNIEIEKEKFEEKIENNPPPKYILQESTDEESRKIDEIIMTFESIRISDPEQFKKLMMVNQVFLDVVQNYENKSDLDKLQNMIGLVDNNIDLLYWSLNKSLRIAILDKKNIDLVHFFVVKHKVKVNTHIFKSIVKEFVESLSHLNFIELDEGVVEVFSCILEMLINYGNADVNYQDEETKDSALHSAVLNNQYQLIIFLFKFGANVNCSNKKLETPMDIAIKNSNREGGDEVAEEIIDLLASMEGEAYRYKHHLLR